MSRLFGRLDAASNQDVAVQGVSRDSAQHRKMMSKLDRISKEFNPADETAFLAHIEAMSEVTLDTTSQSVINRRRRIGNLWLAVIRTFDPEFNGDEWDVKVVTKYLERFLPVVLLITDPRKGHTAIRSTTLQSAFQNIIILVCQHCLDPATGLKTGFKLLTNTGMFIRMKKQMTGLIAKYQLERSPHIKLYYGREHVHAILKCMLSNSERFGPVRLYVLQSAARFLLTFYTTCRPSTGGPTEDKWATAGRYPKLSDIKIRRKGYMTFEISIRLSNFKGAISTVDAAVQDIVLHPVMFAHNVFLDPTNWFMALFFARGAFAKKYQTPEDLAMDTDAEIMLDPAMLDEPLFREMSKGGRGFSDRIWPASAKSGSQAFGRACVEAGLPRQGMYAMRRDAGNAYYYQLGRQLVRLLMNHTEDIGVIEKDYLRGPGDLELVSVRLGEVAGPQESHAGKVLGDSRKHHLFNDVLVESVLRFEGKSVSELKNEKRVERHPKVDATAKVLEINLDLDNVWREYRRCFTFQASNYDLCTNANVSRIYNAAQKDGKVIQFRVGSEERAGELREQLREIFGARIKARRGINRNAVLEDERDFTLSFFQDALTGSTDERNQVMKDLEGQGLDHVRDVVQDAVGAEDEEEDEEEEDEMAEVDDDGGNDDNDDDEDDSIDIDDDDDDDDDIDITPEMLEKYRDTTGSQGDNDPCKFKGDLAEWDKNLRFGLQLEAMDVEEEEDGQLLPKEFAFVENMAEAKAKQGGMNLEASSLEIEGHPNPPKDLDESQEPDVLGLNPGEVRRIFFDMLVKPVIWEKSILVHADDGKKGYACELCRHVAVSPFMYTRHKHTNHSAWRNLEVDMFVGSEDLFVCPYGGCDFEADTIRKVVLHMTGVTKEGMDKCPNAEEFRRIKAGHGAAVPVDHRRARQLEARMHPEVNHVIPSTNPDLVGLNNILESYADGEDVNDPKWHTATTSDWRSLQSVGLLGMDFDKFRSQPMDLDEHVSFIDES